MFQGNVYSLLLVSLKASVDACLYSLYVFSAPNNETLGDLTRILSLGVREVMTVLILEWTRFSWCPVTPPVVQ